MATADAHRSEHGGALAVADPGLTAAEVAARVSGGQTNAVAGRASRSAWEIMRANVFTRFNAILGALFAAILIIGPWQDALFGFVILINTGIGVIQEWRAKRTLDRLAILGQARPRVRRDGLVTDVPPEQVVLDDIIVLAPGEQLVVDGTLLNAAGLEIDESLLTGEADPVVRQPGDPVLSGSFVTAGTGAYRAVKVGRHAFAARLTEQASQFSLTDSHLRTGINKILTWIAWLFTPVAALTIYGQLRGNQSFTDTARGTVAALVPMVPEGLVLLTSIAVAVGVIRLADRHCLVQEMVAIEGLARVDVVCTDKTGTLTEPGMRVDHVDVLEPTARESGISATSRSDAERALAALAAADPVPNTSIRAIADAFPEPPDWVVTSTVPFSSATKWSAVTFAGHGTWLLGAPDVLLPATDSTVAAAAVLGARGLRVLLLGHADHTDHAVPGRIVPGAVTAVALVALTQSIRPDAAATLEYFAAQRVAVKVISGDSPTAAGAVATQLGLPAADHPVDARTLPAEAAGLAEHLTRASVFGRVTPAQKQHMVAALRAAGHTVAMTGDGVNDVLALKEADIGVAMGSGSPAARAVAQIVLLDNAFATLPRVVAEGRRVIGNIERVATLFLVKTAYATLLAVLVGAARLPFPFLPRHLTLIGTLTIGVPAFFLALAPNTDRVRSGLITRALRSAVPIGAIAASATMACYWLTRAETDASLTQQRSSAVITLFLVALWTLVLLARPFAWWKTALVAIIAGLFALVVLIPAGQRFFELDPTNPIAVLIALGAAAVGIGVVHAIFPVLAHPANRF